MITMFLLVSYFADFFPRKLVLHDRHFVAKVLD